MNRTHFVVVSITLTAARLAFAQPIPDYALGFVTIGDPGNPAWSGEDAIFGITDNAGHGDVAYEYRIMRTEVTAEQWFEFVQAYAPYVDPQFRSGSSFTGPLVTFIGPGPDGVPRYRLNQGGEDLPTTMSWRFAARFCNWLHNGKVSKRWAFETGVYDTSTFGDIVIDGITFGFTDQVAHDPGARFWIPTLDEWMKAAYWDPDKEGPGVGGWWQYPNGSNEPLISGPPGEGQTSTGVPSVPLQPAGSYPEVNKPWGLLDVSGQRSEWLEDIPNGRPTARLVKESFTFSPHHELIDLIGFIGRNSPNVTFHGVRIASRVEDLSLTKTDLNRDGVVNVWDVTYILNAWGPCPGGDTVGCSNDITGDGRVDGADLREVLVSWSLQNEPREEAATRHGRPSCTNALFHGRKIRT